MEHGIEELWNIKKVSKEQVILEKMKKKGCRSIELLNFLRTRVLLEIFGVF